MARLGDVAPAHAAAAAAEAAGALPCPAPLSIEAALPRRWRTARLALATGAALAVVGTATAGLGPARFGAAPRAAADTPAAESAAHHALSARAPSASLGEAEPQPRAARRLDDTSCGGKDVWPCGDALSCTPYDFRPKVQVGECEANYDGSGAEGQGLINQITGGKWNAKAWSGFGTNSDWFALHGCDGAGIQPDCAGDFWYAEHFIDPLSFSEGCSGWGQEVDDHNVCNFRHPYTSKGPDTSGDSRNNYGQYYCGWWNFGDLKGKDWLAGPARSTGFNWYDNLVEGNNNPGHQFFNTVPLENPNPDGAFNIVMTLSPWVCSKATDGSDYSAFTGTADEKCYCDNEPQNSRTGGAPEPNWGTIVQYCSGQFQDQDGHWYMKCQRWYMSGQKLNDEFRLYACEDWDGHCQL